jgi:hypothetical protein
VSARLVRLEVKMALRKQDVVRLQILRDQAVVLPRPLLELYNRASLFLDKKSTHQDHYWAVGIHKAIHASFPECGGTHTATTTNPLTQAKGSSSCQVSPHDYRTRNHICDTPDRCSVASIAREIREEEEK